MKILDVVALEKDFAEEGLYRGQVGTIVDCSSKGDLLVEFADLQGQTYAFLAVNESDLILLHHRPGLKVA